MTALKQRIARWVSEKQTGIGKSMRASQFAELHVLPGDVVFLGDSITEGGAWHEWFPGVPVRNRGIGGETTREVLARIGTATTGGAAGIFVLIGTNDVTLFVPDDEIVENVTQILRALRAASPGTPIFLQSVMPRRGPLAARLQGLNDRLQRVAADENVTWIDLWPALSDGSGALRPDFSLDSIHLTGTGYAAWCNVLRSHVETVAGSASPPTAS